MMKIHEKLYELMETPKEYRVNKALAYCIGTSLKAMGYKTRSSLTFRT